MRKIIAVIVVSILAVQVQWRGEYLGPRYTPRWSPYDSYPQRPRVEDPNWVTPNQRYFNQEMEGWYRYNTRPRWRAYPY